MRWIDFKHKINKFPVAIGVITPIVIIILSNFFTQFELKTLDWRFKLRGKIKPAEEVVIIKIDDATIKKLGWPITRNYYALLVDFLSRANAKVIGIDVVFADADWTNQGYDVLLSEVIKLATNTTTCLAAGFTLNTNKKGYYDAIDATFPVNTLLHSNAKLGHINMLPDIDGIRRKVPLLISYNDNFYPFLGLQMAMSAMNISIDKIKIKNNYLYLGNCKIPVNDKLEMIVNYAGSGDDFEQYSFLDITRFVKFDGTNLPEIQSEAFKDKIILIGVTAKGIPEICPTPISTTYPAFEIHANVASNILQNKFITKVATIYNWILVILIGSIMGLLFVIWQASLYKHIILWTISLIAIIVINYILFKQGIWIDMVSPVLTIVSTGIALTGYDRRDKIRMLQILQFTSFFQNRYIQELKRRVILLIQEKEQIEKERIKTLEMLDKEISERQKIINQMQNTLGSINKEAEKREKILNEIKNLSAHISKIQTQKAKDNEYYEDKLREKDHKIKELEEIIKSRKKKLIINFRLLHVDIIVDEYKTNISASSNRREYQLLKYIIKEKLHLGAYIHWIWGYPLFDWGSKPVENPSTDFSKVVSVLNKKFKIKILGRVSEGGYPILLENYELESNLFPNNLEQGNIDEICNLLQIDIENQQGWKLLAKMQEKSDLKQQQKGKLLKNINDEIKRYKNSIDIIKERHANIIDIDDSLAQKAFWEIEDKLEKLTKLRDEVYKLFDIKDQPEQSKDDSHLLAKIQQWIQTLKNMMDKSAMSDKEKEEYFYKELEREKEIDDFISSIIKKIGNSDEIKQYLSELIYVIYKIFIERAKPEKWETINNLKGYLYKSLKFALIDMKGIENYKITDDPGGWTKETKLRYYREYKKMYSKLMDELQRLPSKQELCEQLGWSEQVYEKVFLLAQFIEKN
jgi:CHASE2 domain-containing sensor protein